MLHVRFSPARRAKGVRARLIAVVLIALAAVAACSSSASVPFSGGTGEGGPVAAPVSAAPVAPGRDATGGSSTGTSDGVVTADPQDGPLIVRTGSLALQVKDIDDSLLQARARITGLGGYVSDSERANAGAGSTALITYRIPATHWDEAMDEAQNLVSQGVKGAVEELLEMPMLASVLDSGLAAFDLNCDGVGELA